MTKPVALAQFEGDWSDLAGTDMKTPLAKPVAPEVDLDELAVLASVGEACECAAAVPTKTLRAIIAETRAHRAANRPHIGSCGGCFFAEVELLAALKDGAEAGEPAEKLLRRVLDVLLDEAHRPACAAKIPPVGVVTREHRIAALESRFEGCRYYDLHCGVGYAETGDMRGILPEVSRAAQAIADAEARGRASVVDTDLAGAERELVEANVAHELATSHETSDRLEKAIRAVMAIRAASKGDK